MSEKHTHNHNGHRSRLLEKVSKYGAGCLADHEILEALLFFSIARVNTNEIAHNIIHEMGSLQRITDADESRLLSIHGIGSKTVIFFMLIFELFRRISAKSTVPTVKFDSITKVFDFLSRHYTGIKNEQVCALYLDGMFRLVKFETVAEGSISSVSVNPAVIARQAAKYDAVSVIIAHNHPKGYSKPSEADLLFTKALREHLFAVDVTLLEHIIVGEDSCKTTMQHSLYNDNEPMNRKAGTNEQFFVNFYKDLP